MRWCLVALSSLCILRCAAQTALPPRIPFRDGNKWGYCDAAGVVKIAPQWDEAEFFCGNRAVVKTSGSYLEEAYGLIDTNGRYIIPVSMHWNRGWDGWARTMLNAHDSAGRFGLVDTNGTVLVPFEYERHSFYRPTAGDGYRIVNRNGRVGIINAANEVLIPFDYDDIEEVTLPGDSLPLFRVGRGTQRGMGYLHGDARHGLMNIRGEVILPLRYAQVYRAPDTGAARRLRPGFQLVNYPPGKADVQQSPSLYGWMDYPGTLLIEPQHKSLYWLTKDYYTTDQHLYNSKNKRVRSKNYTGFYRTGDTIYAERLLKSSKQKGKLIALYAFRAADLTVLSRSEAVWYPPGGSGYQRPLCGTASYQARRCEEREHSRPSVRVNGELVKHFEEDGFHWTTQLYLPGGYRAVTGRQEGIYRKEPWAVCDSNGYLVSRILPAESMGSIVGYNPASRYIIWQRDTSFGVSDLHGREIAAYRTYLISDTYAFHGEDYLVRSSYVRPQRSWGDDEEERRAPVTAGQRPQLCYAGGAPVSALAKYSFLYPVDSNYQKTARLNGVVLVQDSLGRKGFMTLDGKVLLPALSFRYRRLEVVTAQVFLAGRGVNQDDTARLVGSDNRELFPGARIERAALLRNRSHSYPQPLYTNNAVEETDLIEVQFRKDGRSGKLYMNAHGRLYAAGL